ncbi:MAG: hypothetical protein KGL39_29420 [Patescibacteria group bacterium]|nr:hypothetical protein [Patescibacteria group bacterium]
MYSQRISDASLASAAASLKIEVPERLPLSYLSQVVSHLDSIVEIERDRISGLPRHIEFKRPLKPDEAALIRGQRLLCKYDFRYWVSRFYMIRSLSGDLIHFAPNVAQSIVLDIWADMEERGLSIELQQLKARQLGVSTLTEGAAQHRPQFYSQVNAVVASSSPEQSEKMSGMMLLSLQQQPWWLLPDVTLFRIGALIEFGRQNSTISIQHGAQTTGIARGTTPNVIHLSELAGFSDPESIVESSLFRAVHSSPNVLMVLESTAEGLHDWWHDTWEYSKENWASGRSRLRPIFLPWFLGSDLYPTATWLRGHPIPRDWQPLSITSRHARSAAAYVRANDLLRHYLGPRWEMPREQMWFWECGYLEARAKKILNLWYQEMPSCIRGDYRVSTDRDGMVPIREVVDRRLKAASGTVVGWHANGVRPLVKLTTKFGRVFYCTPEHKLKLSEGNDWIEAENSIGKVVSLSRIKFAANIYEASWSWTSQCRMSLAITERWGRFLGYFMGDGCWSRDSVDIACCGNDPDVIEDATKLLTELNDGKPPSREFRGKGLTIVTSTNRRWRDIMLGLGCLQWRLKQDERDPEISNRIRRTGYKRKVCVPEAIWRSPKSVVMEFLSALFECDAHAYPYVARTIMSSKHIEFARDIQTLLLGFGINSSVVASPKTADSGRVFDQYSIVLPAQASDRFHEEIGFIGKRKRSGARSCGSHATRAIPNVMEDKVIEVVPAESGEVFDLTVDPSHTYDAGGFQVHNCDLEAFQSANVSAFDHETIAEYQAGACEPLAVFGLRGPDVAFRLQPDQADLDPSLPTIEVLPITDEGLPYSLVPLKWDSCSQSDPFGKFLIWEFPEPEQTYGIGIDTSDGIGEDRTVISVLRKGTMEANDALVAQFISPYVNAFDLPPFAYAIAAFYSPLDLESGEARQAKMVIEIAGNGESTQLELRKRGWRNFHQWVRYDTKKLKESRATRFGWFTNSWSRPMMLDWLLKAIKDNWLDIPSTYFVQEMKDLERNTDRQSMKAAHGGHDDQIMSLGIVFFSMWALELRQARASSPGDTDFKGANPLTGRRISRPRLTYGSDGLLDPAVAAKVRDPSRYPSYSAPEQASALASDSPMRRYMIEDGERKIEEAEQGEREELYERIGAYHE